MGPLHLLLQVLDLVVELEQVVGTASLTQLV
jgi:hypothetical protein